MFLPKFNVCQMYHQTICCRWLPAIPSTPCIRACLHINGFQWIYHEPTEPGGCNVLLKTQKYFPATNINFLLVTVIVNFTKVIISHAKHLQCKTVQPSKVDHESYLKVNA